MTANIRIGLYICHCGHNIAAVVKPGSLAAKAQTLPDVALCRHHLYTCSESGQREIIADIQEHDLNRVLVAACSPKLHEFTFRRALQAAGLNPYLLEMVNIREHCSWVHGHDPQGAEAKALELIKMGLAKVRLAAPLSERRVPLTRRALVIGGGPAGLRAALDIAEAGYPVVLVERQPVLGGLANRLHRTFPRGEHALRLINPLMAAVLLHPRIEVLTSSEVTEVTGHLGNFQVTVRQDPPLVGPECDLCGLCREVCPVTLPSGERFADPHRPALYQPAATAFPPGFVIDPHLCTRCGLCVAICPQGAIDLAAREARLHFAIGALVVATGAKPYDFADGPQQAWAALPRVATTLDLERLLAESPHSSAWDKLLGPEPPRDLAFILCVGSRQEHGNRYCSRICCPTALHQALELRERFPQTRIHIYFRDIRTGKPEWEDLYRRAREAGILFHRGRVHDLQTSDAGRVLIEFEPLGASESLSDSVDAAILAVGLTPGGGRSLKSALRLPLSSDGFFLEAHPKLRPLETALDCVYLAGTCQGPKDLGETLTQASGAASKILSLFAHETLTLEGILCAIDPAKCQGCGLCARQCPFQAIEMVPVDGATQAQIIPSACKGCGVCAGACPEGAVIAHGFTDEMIAAQIDNALADNPAGKILAFCCNWCSYAGADFAGVSRLEYPAAVRIIRTMCAGRVHPKFIRRALEKGAGQVLVTGCHPPGDCHYLSGNLRAQARVAKLKQKLPSLGLDPHRLHLAWISATEGRAFQQLITQLAQELQTNSSSSTTTVPEATP